MVGRTSAGKAGLLPVWTSLAVVSTLIAIFLALEWFAILPEAAKSRGDLTEVEEAALATLKELSHLFIGWALAIIGGTAYFLKAAVEGDHQLTRPGLLAAEGVIVCAVVSIFFGHLTLNAALNMLALGLFDARDRAVVTYGIGQYLAFLVALMAFFVFIHVTYWTTVVVKEGSK